MGGKGERKGRMGGAAKRAHCKPGYPHLREGASFWRRKRDIVQKKRRQRSFPREKGRKNGGKWPGWNEGTSCATGCIPSKQVMTKDDHLSGKKRKEKGKKGDQSLKVARPSIGGPSLFNRRRGKLRHNGSSRRRKKGGRGGKEAKKRDRGMCYHSYYDMDLLISSEKSAAGN